MSGDGTIDPDVAQRGAADPTTSVWVAASAGTGKTKVLTDRVLRLMLAGTEPRKILGLTFTKAAAAEMTVRITRELGRWAAASDEALAADLGKLLGTAAGDAVMTRARQLFTRVLDEPDGINVRTIHAFCQSVLSRFPLEAGVPPGFAVIEEREQRELVAVARGRLLQRTGEAGAVGAALAALSDRLAEATFADLLDLIVTRRREFGALAERPGGLDAVIADIRDHLGVAAGDTAGSVLAAGCADAAFDAAGLQRVAAVLAGGTATDDALAGTIVAWLAAVPGDRAGLLDAFAKALLTEDKTDGGRKPKQFRSARLTKAGGNLRDILADEALRLLAVTDRLAAITTADATAALLTAGDALLDGYARLKAGRGALDFDDLIDRTAALLDARGGPSWVMYKLDGGIEHLLIDEAQDTNPAQWQVIQALVGEFFASGRSGARGRTVFGVGDVKQSIYSFQGAEPTAFLAARNRFEAAARAAGERFCSLDLSVSFRSTRAVLQAVDRVFSRPEARDGVVDGDRPVEHQAWRRLDGGSVEVWPLVPKAVTASPGPWALPVPGDDDPPAELRLCELLARRIGRMIADGEMLPSRGRAIRPGDILVLVRRRGRIMDELVRLLKRLDVPVAGVDRMILTEQLAIMDLVALGRFALLPTDDLSLACVLKGPLIGLDEDQLCRIAHGREGRLWPALAAAADADPACAPAVARLREVLAIADTAPPFEFFAHILGSMAGRRRLLARLGRDAEDPIGEFMALALAYERDHPPSLQGFLHWLERTATESKRNLEQAGPTAVRVMTVHGAKGLQAPVVILPDTTAARQPRFDVVWTDKVEQGGLPLWPPGPADRTAASEAARDRHKRAEAREANRLLYVAMTRAEDRLIVCGWEPARAQPACRWYDLVHDALAADPAAERLPDPFLAEAGATDGAAVLRLSCPQEAAAKPAEAAATAAASPPLPDWTGRPAPAESAPARAAAPSRRAAPGRPGRTGDGVDREMRVRRGLLIHRLLQSLPDLPARTREARARAWLARPDLRLDPGQQAEILATVMALFADPAFAPLFAAGSRAEVAVAGRVGGAWVEGRIDRLAVTAGAVTVVDYKTDQSVPKTVTAVPAVYLRQLAVYRDLVRQVWPDRPVCSRLLWTAGPVLMRVPDDRLDPRQSGP